jgi:hypothetical protein
LSPLGFFFATILFVGICVAIVGSAVIYVVERNRSPDAGFLSASLRKFREKTCVKVNYLD